MFNNDNFLVFSATECLYKHSDSRYAGQPGVPSPVVPAHLRASAQGRLAPRSRGSRPPSHTPQTAGLRIDSHSAELHDGGRTPSLSVSHSPVKMFSPSPPKSRGSSAVGRSPSKKAWSTTPPETQVWDPTVAQQV